MKSEAYFFISPLDEVAYKNDHGAFLTERTGSFGRGERNAQCTHRGSHLFGVLFKESGRWVDQCNRKRIRLIERKQSGDTGG